MKGYSKTILMGNVTADPEFRVTESGRKFITFSVVTNEITYTGEIGEKYEHTEYHKVIAWGTRAEALLRIVKKGCQILIEGGNRTTSYTGTDGNKKIITQVLLDTFTLTGFKANRNEKEEYLGKTINDKLKGGSSIHTTGESIKDDDELPF